MLAAVDRGGAAGGLVADASGIRLPVGLCGLTILRAEQVRYVQAAKAPLEIKSRTFRD